MSPVAAALALRAKTEPRSQPSPTLTGQSRSPRSRVPTYRHSPYSGPPPHPSCLPPWVPGHGKELLPSRHSRFLQRAGDKYLARRRRGRLTAWDWRKCVVLAFSSVTQPNLRASVSKPQPMRFQGFWIPRMQRPPNPISAVKH